MTPHEASLVELEVDWKERFEEHRRRWPRLPHYLAQDSAFEATLTDWRRFHATTVEVGGELKRRPAEPALAMIALARLGITPPRSLIRDIPDDGKCLEPDVGDAHCWLQIAGRAWRIAGVEDKILLLESFGESKQIDLSSARWSGYIESATAYLDALRPPTI
jgi:hypothetical protein